MTNPESGALAARIAASVDAMLAMRQAIVAAAPLPPGANVAHEEDAWGPREIVAHVVEAIGYWSGELERILAADPGAGTVRFGRTADDVLRVATVDRDRLLPPGVLLDRLARVAPIVAARVGGLSAAELARRARHVAWGEVTVADCLERTLAGHFEAHLAQLRAVAAG